MCILFELFLPLKQKVKLFFKLFQMLANLGWKSLSFKRLVTNID